LYIQHFPLQDDVAALPDVYNGPGPAIVQAGPNDNGGPAQNGNEGAAGGPEQQVIIWENL
jgi:hypothetical protein